jgi:hypothetical protein
MGSHRDDKRLVSQEKKVADAARNPSIMERALLGWRSRIQ